MNKKKAGHHDFRWNTSRTAWDKLPADPTGPREARSAGGIDGDLVIVGTENTPPAPAARATWNP